MKAHQLYIKTPLIHSPSFSAGCEAAVWLKMEALQPSGSFKLRGIAAACCARIAQGAQALVCSSGGNAGIAVAYCGRKLGVPVTVVVPVSTSAAAIEKIKQERAQVVVKGHTWSEAHAHANAIACDGCAYIHPFDDPVIWNGHSTIVDEVLDDGPRPDLVVLSVGGGGLMCGIIEGLRANGMAHVPVLAVETIGAHSLWACIQEKHHVALEDITSIATSLGAKQVAAEAYALSRRHPVISRRVSDAQAVAAVLRFLDQHRLLVEPACGAALAAVLDPPPCFSGKRNIMVVVCGGAGVDLQQLLQWKSSFRIA